VHHQAQQERVFNLIYLLIFLSSPTVEVLLLEKLPFLGEDNFDPSQDYWKSYKDFKFLFSSLIFSLKPELNANFISMFNPLGLWQYLKSTYKVQGLSSLPQHFINDNGYLQCIKQTSTKEGIIIHSFVNQFHKKYRPLSSS
jgi:hypothetical protein